MDQIFVTDVTLGLWALRDDIRCCLNRRLGGSSRGGQHDDRHGPQKGSSYVHLVSIDTHVSNLRKKIGHEVNGVERIKTIRGIGYIYAPEE